MKALDDVSGAAVRRSLFISGGIVAVALAAAILWLGRDRWTPPPQPPRAAAPGPERNAPLAAAPAVAPPAPSPSAAPPPSFDVVRINPQGDAVIAGRAAPNADVSVRDGGTEIGRTRADSQGEWVVIPDKPLSPGKHDLSIATHGPGNGEVATSQDKVTFDLPEAKPPAPEVVAAGASSPPAAPATPPAVTVARGGTLWGIARDSYGSGTRYMTIYAANRDRISNPDLIYPGQVVKLPAGQ
jgi:nucleoid-associated protein YgaU